MGKTDPAAFRRLCVETIDKAWFGFFDPPAAFRRLCVETGEAMRQAYELAQPPSGGSVLKQQKCPRHLQPEGTSRL